MSTLTATNRLPTAPDEAALAARRRGLLYVTVVALALRLAVMSFGHTYRFDPRQDHFGFGWEQGRIARAIAEGQGFSNVFGDSTGATAWAAPVYPYLLAGIFKAYGVYTAKAAWWALALNSLFSALTCIPIFLIGERVFSVPVAKWSAWLWALLPFMMYWAIRWAWETSLTTLLLSWVVLLSLQLREQPRLKLWVTYGLLWGVLALTNPSLLAFLPFSALWIVRQQRQWNRAAIAAAAFLVIVTPWLVRNAAVLGKFIFIRDNAGAELRLGNGPGADGTWMFMLHPSQNQVELEKYKRLGELEYVRQRGNEARMWIKENPRRFAEISLKRVAFFWIGAPRVGDSPAQGRLRALAFALSSVLALLGLLRAFRVSSAAAWLFAWLLISAPMIYYVTFTHPRYRHPLEPVMLLLSVYVFSGRRKTENQLLETHAAS